MDKVHRNKILARWRERNREKLRKQHKEWYSRHKSEPELKAAKKFYFTDWLSRNRDKRNAWARQYRRRNIEKVRLRKKQWYLDNPEKVKLMRKNELRTVGARIASYMRTRVRLAVLSQKTWKRGKTIELLGCSIPALKEHLEKRFVNGMSWDNYGKWHIDHIRPLSSFDLTNEEEQRKAFHYTNLQPLWALDNLVKGRKLKKGGET